MDFELTRHARDVMGERRIPLEWVARVIRKPERAEPDKMVSGFEHRLASIHEKGARVLRVVLDVKVEPARVITVYFDRRMKGRL